MPICLPCLSVWRRYGPRTWKLLWKKDIAHPILEGSSFYKAPECLVSVIMSEFVACSLDTHEPANPVAARCGPIDRFRQGAEVSVLSNSVFTVGHKLKPHNAEKSLKRVRRTSKVYLACRPCASHSTVPQPTTCCRMRMHTVSRRNSKTASSTCSEKPVTAILS